MIWLTKIMKTVTLIAPKARNRCATDLTAITTPLSGLLILGTILDRNGYSVNFFDESIKIPDYEKIDSDYILINSMSATVNRAYELADFFRNKGKKVFMGGIHVSFRPEEALNHCDKVVVGEGENVLLDLLKDKYNEKIVKGIQVDNLDSIPLPDYKLVDGMKGKPKIVSVCTSRGCPYSCRFCSLKNMFGNNYRTISPDKVIDHLKHFRKCKILCFDEANFTADSNRVITILKKMKENDINPKRCWPSVSIEVAKNDELLKSFAEVSHFHLLIGLESINQKVLNGFNKKQTPAIMRKSIKKIMDYGLKVQGSFIFGSDYDDKSVFQKTVDFCQDTDIGFPIFSALTPYVGTDIRKDLEKNDRIFTNNWDYYDGAHVVFNPKNMTPYELQDGIISAYENFYSSSKVFHHFRNGELFYGLEALYVKHLAKKIIRENEDYLDYLDKVCNKAL
jgi:radical SAM superfamily enzyme YgiQ (UPF0313 family)